MIQMWLAQAILAGLVTREEADKICERMKPMPIPDNPSAIYNELMDEIAVEKARFTAIARTDVRLS